MAGAVGPAAGCGLPPGVGLTRDGSFTGAARTAGTYVATVGSCRVAFVAAPGICSERQLTVTVLGASLTDRTPPCAVEPLGVRDVGSAEFDTAGSALVFVDSLGLGVYAAHLYRTASGHLERLPIDLADDTAPVDRSNAVAISGDGRTVIYDLPWTQVGSTYFTDVAMHDSVTGGTRVAFRIEGLVNDLVLGPDADRAYVVVVGGNPSGGLFTADLATGAVARLGSQFLGSVIDVSDDGTSLLGHSIGSPVLLDTATGASTPITPDPGTSEEPVGFGDSSSVVLTLRRADEGRSLRARDLSTGATTTIATAAGLRDVRSSRGGRSLAFTADGDPLGLNANGGTEVFVQAGTGATTQVTETSGAGQLELLAVSDDGRLVVFAAPGTLDAAGRGTLNESRTNRSLYLARCGGTTVLARSG